MPTLTTKTVKSAGGDYTSLASAEAGEQKNLVAADEQLTIECYSLADTTRVTFDGWTTDSTRYIRVVAPSGERHSGVWNTSKYYLEMATTGDPGGVINIREDYTRLEYLQVRNTKASPPVFNDCVYVENNSTGVIIDGCICRDGYRGVSFNNGGVTNEIRNSICYGATNAAIYLTQSSGFHHLVQNCTAIGGTNGVGGSLSDYPTTKNVYANGSTRAFAQFINKTNCMSNDTTATDTSGGESATNCTNNVAYSTSNFTNVTAGSENLLLPSGSALIDAGIDLSGTFTNDIDGTTRPQNSVFDIGADEFVAAAPGGQPTWKRFGGVPYVAINPGVW